MNTTRTLKGMPKDMDRMENLYYEQKAFRKARHEVHGSQKKSSGRNVSDKRRQMKLDSIRFQELMEEAM